MFEDVFYRRAVDETRRLAERSGARIVPVDALRKWIG